MTMSGNVPVRYDLFSRNHRNQVLTACASLSACTLPVRSLVRSSHASMKLRPLASLSMSASLVSFSMVEPSDDASLGTLSRHVLSMRMELEIVLSPTAGRRTISEFMEVNPCLSWSLSKVFLIVPVGPV